MTSCLWLYTVAPEIDPYTNTTNAGRIRANSIISAPRSDRAPKKRRNKLRLRVRRSGFDCARIVVSDSGVITSFVGANFGGLDDAGPDFCAGLPESGRCPDYFLPR